MPPDLPPSAHAASGLPKPGGSTSPAHAASSSVPAPPGASALSWLHDDVLHLINKPGPRYTSYPTADRFHTRFGPQDHEHALYRRLHSGGAGAVAPVGLYVHIPFCESVCYYCACNKVITRQHGRAAPYLEDLVRELELHLQIVEDRLTVSQLHFGGGSPTFLSDAELTHLLGEIRRRVSFTQDAELAIEVDPRTVDTRRLATLYGLGFNRLSLGVQDFEPDVQAAVHRIQPVEQVRALVSDARQMGFESLNTDLIYGLPRQTPASFSRTLDQLVEIRPDRVALYAYAHLPQRFKAQRRIHEAELPSATQRLQMLDLAIRRLVTEGYDYIGMDHFALHADPLAQAKRQGRLTRNFQGYSTLADCDIVALGVSAIGKLGATYSQNHRDLPAYHAALQRGEFPVERGIQLSRDDLVRRSVIQALMCQGRVEYSAIEMAHLIDFRRYFATELQALEPWRQAGFLETDADALVLTDKGWFGVRALAMVFDRHLQAAPTAAAYSRIA